VDVGNYEPSACEEDGTAEPGLRGLRRQD
jgi:hypothetical protein